MICDRLALFTVAQAGSAVTGQSSGLTWTTEVRSANAERRDFIDRYPGYRAEVENAWRKVDLARADQARIAVAMARTRE